MRPTRLLVSLATGALVAVPGFALAQGAPFDTPPVTPPPAETPVTPKAEVEQPDEPEGVEPERIEPEQVEQEQADEPAADERDGEDVGPDADGRGATIATLARCLPSGRDLHGTGLTKGRMISQAASTGQVELPDESTRPVTSPATAIELCEAVEDLPVEADGERFPGRPDWAGPKDDAEVEDDAEAEETGAAEAGPPEQAGPPDHARRGHGRAHGRD